MLTGPGAFFTVADQLLVAANDKLAATTSAGGRASRAFVTTGSVPWDTCDCGGQLTVAVGREFRTSQFPQDPGSAATARGIIVTPCGSPVRVADMTITIIRCAPTIPEGATFPRAEEMSKSAATVLADAHAVQTAAVCKLAEMQGDWGVDISDWIVRPTTYPDAQGGCVGSELSVTVGILGPCPCEE